MTYVDLRPDDVRPVQVLVDDGSWVTGWLEAYQQRDGVWKGFVRYTLAPSQTYLAWFTEDRIRSVAGAGRSAVLAVDHLGGREPVV